MGCGGTPAALYDQPRLSAFRETLHREIAASTASPRTRSMASMLSESAPVEQAPGWPQVLRLSAGLSRPRRTAYRALTCGYGSTTSSREVRETRARKAAAEVMAIGPPRTRPFQSSRLERLHLMARPTRPGFDHQCRDWAVRASARPRARSASRGRLVHSGRSPRTVGKWPAPCRSNTRAATVPRSRDAASVPDGTTASSVEEHDACCELVFPSTSAVRRRTSPSSGVA